MANEQAWVALGRAWATALGRDVPAGRSLALAAADLAATQGFAGLEVLALHSVVRLGDPGATAGRLGALREQVDGALVGAMAAHAEALVRGDAAALDAAAARFEATRAILCAAEASADAARAHRLASRLAPARAAQARATALAALCEGATTPALAPAGVPDALTEREHEVALLAARGLASRDIAARLRVSVRTVDNHLQRVYAKLEVRTRRELAGLLHAAPAVTPPR